MSEMEIIAEDYRKAAEHHAREGNFHAALGYLDLYFAAAGEDEEAEAS